MSYIKEISKNKTHTLVWNIHNRLFIEKNPPAGVCPLRMG